MQHKLYKQNKLTSSDQSQTWLQLLRKPSQTHIDVPYSNEEIGKDEEADIDEELRRALRPTSRRTAPTPSMPLTSLR